MTSADAPVCAAPRPVTRRPKLKLPPGSVDAHAHVFGPRDRYPYQTNRLYTPPAVLLEDYIAMHDATGITHGVLVQTGVYLTDSRFLVDTLRAHPNRFRAIALIDESITDRELQDLSDAGVRGFRVNRTAKTGLNFDVARRLAERVKPLGWHVQFLLDVEDHPDLDTMLGSFATEVVVDHMGRPDPARGIDAPGFRALVRLLQSGRGWAKLSAPYRTSRGAPPYADLVPFAQALTEAAPDRLVWGLDWPHVLLETEMPDDADLVDQLAVWVPDAAMRTKVLVENPRKLYGFAPMG